MLVFIDFEASSLGKKGFPIEVAWVFEDGHGESHLIRPAPGWTEWDPAAEAVHGIPREKLFAQGRPPDMIARHMVEVLGGHDLYASAPTWDGKWLSALLRAGGMPRHALRLRDTELARRAAVLDRLSPTLGGVELEEAIRRILSEVGQAHDRHAATHRALDDAEQERQEWLLACSLADATLARLAA